MATVFDDPTLEPSAPAPRRPRLLNGTQVMFAVIVAIALMLAVNFSSRVTADRELRRVRDAVQNEIEQLRREQAELIDRLNFVQSDAFIEQWARSQGRMVREGEVLLVLFPMMQADAQLRLRRLSSPRRRPLSPRRRPRGIRGGRCSSTRRRPALKLRAPLATTPAVCRADPRR